MIKTIKNTYYNLRYSKYQGTSPDTRSDLQKSKDYKYEEIASGETLPTFRNVVDSDWAKYSTRSQGNSGSCVANTVAKMLEVKARVKFSHALIYNHRSNKPQPGMIGVEALSFAKTYGVLESDIPSESLSDVQLDAILTPDNLEDINNWAVANGYYTADRNFQTAADIIAKEGSVMLWFNTDFNSWCRDIPSTGGFKEQVRHSVTGVDSITLDDKKYIVVEDSWGKFGGKYGKDGQRLICEEFFNEANYFVAALTNFTFGESKKPRKKLTTSLAFGNKSDNVILLQNILKAKGCFPANQPSTGYYGNITAKAVYRFQIENKVDLTDIPIGKEGYYVGPKTLKALAK